MIIIRITTQNKKFWAYFWYSDDATESVSSRKAAFFIPIYAVFLVMRSSSASFNLQIITSTVEFSPLGVFELQRYQVLKCMELTEKIPLA